MTTARSARAKGKAFEKAVAEAVADWLGLTVDDIIRARSGKDECDIGLSAEARRRFDYWLECKNHKTLKIPEWIRQARDAAARAKKRGEGHGTPVIVFKTHGDGTPYVVIDFFSFMELATRHLVKGTE